MITAFIGDSERSLKILPEHIEELEKLTGSAIGVLYGRIMSAQFHFKDLLTIVQLGLIGGGMDDREAWNLTETYVKTRPVMQTLPVALDLIEQVWSGETLSADGQGAV
ncbi:gene transfer agent family protein [Brucella sp. 458]|uniref:gene transfer agent family protein n=1 Tax=Brucella sp. 458 TaxID=2821140 RepID=UPI001AE0B7F8|nr:gene transfer agent family protein [Brucella sp. 458]QTN98183.1 gene transfer agent family protein [Brucella sp. 458]